MKHSIVLAILALAFAGPAYAAEGDGEREGRQGKRGHRKARLLKKFDADGDGKLSETERGSAKAARKERRGGTAEEGQGKRGKKGKRCRGKHRRGRSGEARGEEERSGKKRGKRKNRGRRGNRSAE